VIADHARDLSAERQPVAEGAVQRCAGETVVVGAVEPARLCPHRPGAPRAAREGTDGADPVPRRVERIGAQEGDGVEAVILRTPLHPVTDQAEAYVLRRQSLDAQIRRHCLEPVPLAAGAEGVDAVAALPAEPGADPDIAGSHR